MIYYRNSIDHQWELRSPLIGKTDKCWRVAYDPWKRCFSEMDLESYGFLLKINISKIADIKRNASGGKLKHVRFSSKRLLDKMSWEMLFLIVSKNRLRTGRLCSS